MPLRGRVPPWRHLTGLSGPREGHWCTVVRPDCGCALDHADCVLVASDKPSHMTYLTAALPFSNLVKIILCTYILLGAPIFWGAVRRALAYFSSK